MSGSFDIKFLTAGRKATQPPNPAYPNGIDIDVSRGADRTCVVKLPSPARCCGVWHVKCRACGFVAAVTAAGRPDDPRTLRMPCKET
jgi:hypothetical protein